MSLPEISAEAVRAAMRQFDQQLRGLTEWQGWESKRSQLFAIKHSESLYPPKKIVSLATGIPVSGFSGGAATNSYLRRLNFNVISLEQRLPDTGALKIPSFVIGRPYLRSTEITGRFGGSGQSGIASSRQAHAIFLFTGESGEQHGYDDRFDDFGCLLYTGEGQVGNMTLTRGNLAIVNHASEGRALHVFRTTGKGRPCIYAGEFSYSSHFVRRGPDREGSERDVLVFRLVPVGQLSEIETGARSEPAEAGADARPASQAPLSVLREVAITSATNPSSTADAKESLRRIYERSAHVRRYVLARAGGICELCEEPAPFSRRSDGSPYLEPHHINRLSDGGLDHPRYMAAICPACHREIHFGMKGPALNTKLLVRILAIEADLETTG